MTWEFLPLLCVIGCAHCVAHGNDTGSLDEDVMADGRANQHTGEQVPAHEGPRRAEDSRTGDHEDLESFMRLVRSIVEDTSESSQLVRERQAAETSSPKTTASSAAAGSFKGLFAPVHVPDQEVKQQPSSVRVGRKIIPTFFPSIFGQGGESLFSLLRNVKKAMTAPVDQDRDLKSVLGRSVMNFILPNKDGNKLNMGSTWQVLSTLYKSLNSIDLFNKFRAL